MPIASVSQELIDVVRIERAIASDREEQARRSQRRVSAVLAVRAFGMMAAVVFVVPVLADWSLDPLTQLTPRRLLIKCAIVFVGGALWWVGMLVIGRRQARKDVALLAESVVKEWAVLTGPRWGDWVIRMGLTITAGVGLPVGLLMAATFPPTELIQGSRVMMVVGFLGLTALWAFPAALWIRWLTVRGYRRRFGRIA